MNPSPESVQYADYILNHYSKDSYSDKICLARSLEQNIWKSTSNVKAIYQEERESLTDKNNPVE